MPPLDFLNGKKTYFAAAGAGLLGFYYLSTGQFANAQQFLVMALGFAGLRHAVDKAAE